MEDIAAIQSRHFMQCWSAQEGYEPIAVDHTEGCWIHTRDGRRIFDLRSAHECINLGFNIEQEGGSNKVAGMIIEPIVGSNGIIPAPPRYMTMLRELCDRWKLVLIVDETMTGMGRTGKLFAIEHYGIEPYILVMGKALGAYCPLAATIFSETISRGFDRHIFGHGQSFSGHALACAAALASIEALFEEKILENVRDMGAYLEQRLRALGRNHPSVGDVRGLGLFWTLELVRDRKTRKPLRRATEKYAGTIVKEVAEFLFREKNVYVPSDKFGLWVVPPLIVNRQEIDFIVEALDEALQLADQWLSRQAPG